MCLSLKRLRGQKVQGGKIWDFLTRGNFTHQGDSRRSDPRIISFSCYSDSRHDIRQQALPSHGVTDENKHDIK